MKKRDYPLFLIDRSRAANYPRDYVVCLDREVGFVAKVIYFPKTDAWREFLAALHKMEDNEMAGLAMHLRQGGLALQVVDFLYYFEVTASAKNRVQVLLKKALKKYLHAEIERTPHGDLGIENQIKQQKLTIERALEDYDSLVARADGDRDLANMQIDLARETLRSLEKFRDIRDFFGSGFNLNYDPDEQGS